MAIRLSSKGITDSFVLRTQNDITFVIASTERCVAIRFPSPVIAKVRVSGGHLCEAEAPTEPAGETAARRAAIRFFFLNPRIRKALIPRKALRDIKAFNFCIHLKCRLYQALLFLIPHSFAAEARRMLWLPNFSRTLYIEFSSFSSASIFSLLPNISDCTAVS